MPALLETVAPEICAPLKEDAPEKASAEARALKKMTRESFIFFMVFAQVLTLMWK
jgi:hypothetical protein